MVEHVIQTPAPFSPSPTPRSPRAPAGAPPTLTPAAVSPRTPQDTPRGQPELSTPRGEEPKAERHSLNSVPDQPRASVREERNKRRLSSTRQNSSESMESVRSARKSLRDEERGAGWRESHRRQSNQFRAKALRYMQTEDMVQQQANSTRRDILKDVVTKQHKHKNGCLELPLNIAFFVLYAMSARLHEDITNVWLLESAMRHRVYGTLEHVNTIDDVWAWMQTEMVSILFVQRDYYGDELPATDWSRVLLYSQVQGSVIVTQSRDNADSFGVPYAGAALPSYLVPFDAANKGFVSKAALQSSSSSSSQAPAPRRLNVFSALWMSNMMGSPDADDHKYELMLYPTVVQNATVEELKYLEKRRWLDEHTERVRIVALLLNGELGRPRLEQLSITMSFSRGGGIYNRVDLQALFLLPFPRGAAGLMSMGVDFLWVMMLIVNSALCVLNLWNAFIESTVIQHLASGQVPVEFLIMALGWVNVGGFLIQQQGADKVTVALLAVRKLMLADASDASTRTQIDLTEEERLSSRLHADADELITVMEATRTGIAWMTLVLIFRFFSSFRVQPRLAVVTNTLKAVVSDLAHFLCVFLPTFFAYAISGHFLFGRRMEEFSTVDGAIGVCLRIAFENEYEWLQLSDEWFSTAAIWAWSYLIFVVMIMVNMVLAIVLDIYNEVRAGTDSADTIFLFISHIAKRFKHAKQWIPDKDIACLYGEGVDDTTTLNQDDITEAIPQMSASQREMLVKACNMEMAWQAKQDLVTSNYLKLGASIKLSVDEAIEEITDADCEFHATHTPAKEGAASTPVRTPRISQGSEPAGSPNTPITTPRRMVGVSRPFPGMPATPGGYAPLMCAPTTGHPGVMLAAVPKISDEPDWYCDLRDGMQTSSELMEDVQYDLQALHWQWHQLDVRAANQVYGRALARKSTVSLSEVKVANGSAIL